MNGLESPPHRSYMDAIFRIQACKESSISIPELSGLLGIKTTTLNARLRRHRIEVRIVGRTNFIPGGLALRLAEIHRYALIGWPTLRQASELTGLKAGTIKARCEKGQLENYRDLTKRLRINPAELQGLHLQRHSAKRDSAEHPNGWQRRTSGVTRTAATSGSHANCHDKPQLRSRQPAAGDHERFDWTPPAPTRFAPVPLISSQGNRTSTSRSTPSSVRPLPPVSDIRLITGSDYGIPEIQRPATAIVARTSPGQKKSRDGEMLTYNPDSPFSVSACAVGKTVRYDDYDGRIIGIVDDPFSPKIKVRFANHQHPLMREVLLLVGKRKMAD